jgi:sugar lactone lactonase YvrE
MVRNGDGKEKDAPRNILNLELVLDAHARIGESPTWSPTERALYWIDVKRPALFRYHPETGASRSWKVTSDLGAFALMEGNAALVALRHGIHRLDLGSGALDLLAPPPFDPRLFRFNEGVCDTSGRFWVGVMFDPAQGSPPEQRAALHSFTSAGGLERHDDVAALHNGMAWSADGMHLYLAHSYERAISIRSPERSAARSYSRERWSALAFRMVPQSMRKNTTGARSTTADASTDTRRTERSTAKFLFRFPSPPCARSPGTIWTVSMSLALPTV